VATGNNYAAISLSMKKVAQAVIKAGQQVSEGLLNLIEMAYRAYDPCMACATHSLPGQMPLEVVIYNSKREVVEKLSQHCSF